METVLYYEPLPLLAPAALAGVLQRRGLRVVRVTRDQVGQSVGHLAGYQGFEAKAGTETPPQDRVLVFCEVPETTLDAVLEDLKAAGAKVDALDCLALAEEAGSSKAVNIVLMGRLSHYFDLPDEAWQKSLEVCVPSKFLELNKKAFQLGKNA